MSSCNSLVLSLGCMAERVRKEMEVIGIDKERIRRAVKRDGPGMKDSATDMVVERIIHETDPRLEQNVREWSEGKEISDLWVGKYCINAIMSLRGTGIL